MEVGAERTAFLIGMIYEAAVDREKWSTFLKEFGKTLDSHVGMAWANDFSTRGVEVGLSSDFGKTVGIDESLLLSFESHYGQRNVWLSDESRHSEGAVVTDEMLYPGRELLKSEFYADWLVPQDVRYTAASIVEKRNDRSVNVTLARSERAGPYRAEELRLFELLMPHFRAAFDIHRRLHRAHALSASSWQVLEALPFGVVLLDAGGRVLHATARALLASQRSGKVSFSEGRPPRFTSEGDASKLARHVAASKATALGKHGGAGGVIRLLGRQGLCLHLTVVPLPIHAVPFGRDAACAVFVSDDGQALIPCSGDLLRALYELTPVEARLAEALVNGSTVKAYTDVHGVSMATARTQLQSIMRKLGVKRQADIVRVVLTGPAGMQWSAGS